MPEYVAPGVYVEETSFRSKPIEGVATDIAAFIGPTRRGPWGTCPRLLTSFAEFERLYGGFADLRLHLPAGQRNNHLAHAVAGYFANGGRRLYVARTRPNRAGTPPTAEDYTNALATLARCDDVATVAAPGLMARWESEATFCAEVAGQLVTWAAANGRRSLAVLDAPPAASQSDLLAFRDRFDSSHGALYAPWLRITNPLAGNGRPDTLLTPPAGFVCGIYARNDSEKSVAKAPANEPVSGALETERPIGRGEQESLNPAGVNCLRTFEGRGLRVWGARTLSSDPQWQYVNLRRYFNYLESSIDRGTRRAVFEPNGERLWTNIRACIENFLYSEWTSGALLGSKAEQAFFVRCDRSTMTQNDLDNGRLVALIGVAPLRPAEFVIFRIGQWTAAA